MAAAEETIPADVVKQLHGALNQAKVEAAMGLAEPFPDDPQELRQNSWHTLACSWLHSRDLEVLMAAIGYPLSATGIHDMTECVPTEDVIAVVVRSMEAGNSYSDWFLRWVGRLDRRGSVNIDFLNPNLTAEPCARRPISTRSRTRWTPTACQPITTGTATPGYDPVEATINNLLHAREGVTGVQKSAVMSWAELDAGCAPVPRRTDWPSQAWAERCCGTPCRFSATLRERVTSCRGVRWPSSRERSHSSEMSNAMDAFPRRCFAKSSRLWSKSSTAGNCRRRLRFRVDVEFDDIIGKKRFPYVVEAVFKWARRADREAELGLNR